MAWQDKQTNPTSTEAMAYDGEGHRVALKVNGATTYYLGDLEEVAGGVITKYFPSGGAGLPTAMRLGTGGAVSYLATDGRSSVSVALDSAGNATGSKLYDPYGAVYYSSGSFPTTKAYTGQRADAASGLDYYGARYYDPAAGQFASADTASDGLNRYAYVHGNPETYTDPTGHMVVCGGHFDDCGSGGTTSAPPPTGCRATNDCLPPPPPPTGCQATHDCPGMTGDTGDPNIVQKDDAQECYGADHPAWCEKYYDYNLDGVDLEGGLRKGPLGLIGMADCWVFSGGAGVLIAGLYAVVYYIPSAGQWWSPQGVVIGYGGWYGFNLGLKDIPSLVIGFGILLTKGSRANLQELSHFLAGPSDNNEEDYGLHSWSEASNSSGYAWEYHIGIGVGLTSGQSCGWIESFPWQWFPPQFNACPAP